MAKTRPIRVGIVGLGRAGFGMHCRELEGKEDRFRIVAGCDVHKPWLNRMAKAYPDCTLYTRIEDLLADPQVDLVTIATLSVDHHKHVSMALKAGKHVFDEKPMCVTYAEAKRLRAASAKAKGNLYVRHNRRFENGFLHIREILASGILGEIHTIKLARVGYGRRDDWQTLIKCGGGQLSNWGPHIIDHGLQFLGAPKKPLKGIWSDLKLVAAVGDAEDHLKIVMTGATGCVVDIEISGGAAVPLPQYVIWGSKGGLICQGDTITLKYLNPQKKLKGRKPHAGVLPGFGTPEKLPWVEKTLKVKPKKTYDIWDELYNAIRKRKKFPITLDEAVEVMRVVSVAKKGTPFQKK
jgi:predicted dehydrogenase